MNEKDKVKILEMVEPTITVPISLFISKEIQRHDQQILSSMREEVRKAVQESMATHIINCPQLRWIEGHKAKHNEIEKKDSKGRYVMVALWAALLAAFKWLLP